ncbi:MAG: hypothetical protein Q4B82_05570 [Alysiella sp.]|nr:hypothetical protein [Alysiella sp.]MDO4434034.1 hypothetical protein [Alysiella sp.]
MVWFPLAWSSFKAVVRFQAACFSCHIGCLKANSCIDVLWSFQIKNLYS